MRGGSSYEVAFLLSTENEILNGNLRVERRLGNRSRSGKRKLSTPAYRQPFALQTRDVSQIEIASQQIQGNRFGSEIVTRASGDTRAILLKSDVSELKLSIAKLGVGRKRA